VIVEGTVGLGAGLGAVAVGRLATACIAGGGGSWLERVARPGGFFVGGFFVGGLFTGAILEKKELVEEAVEGKELLMYLFEVLEVRIMREK
jgi:hypothetical protein